MMDRSLVTVVVVVVLATFFLLSSSAIQLVRSDESIVDYTIDECTRKCQTDFSGAECWKRPFNFFIIDFVNGLNNHLRLVKYLANAEQEQQQHERVVEASASRHFKRMKRKMDEEFARLLKLVESEFKRENEDLVDNEVENLTDTYERVFEQIKSRSEELYNNSIDALSSRSIELILEESRRASLTHPRCPISECNFNGENGKLYEENYNSQINRYAALTYTFGSISGVLILTYFIVFIYLERKYVAIGSLKINVD